MPPHVSVRDVNRTFGQRENPLRVLDGVCLDIEAGSICLVVGASGSGKSTLLNVIGGLDRPDAGTITIGGHTITGFDDRRLTRFRRDEVGFVFQFYNLIPNLTVRENVAVCAQLVRGPHDIDALLADLDMADQAHKFPAQLSGGQQQRCAIARALVKRSRLLLCDEPTGALDYATSGRLLAVLERVNQRLGTTIVIVTHTAALAGMAHQVVEIRDGRIVRDEANPTPSAAADLEW